MNFTQSFLERPLYSAGIALYRFGVRIAGLRNPKARRLDKGQAEIRDRIAAKIKPGDSVIWVHAASLGEFEQGRPLMEMIRKKHPGYKILLTFFSPSGYEVRKDYPGADCVCYLPFDTPLRVHRFLDRVNPEMAIFVKYEIWRNYLSELNRRGIPTYLISAAFRPTQKFFKPGYGWYGAWLKWFTRIFVQDEGSRQLLKTIGIENVNVAGDTRFDREAEIRANRKEIPELKAFTRRGEADEPAVMMAGSSWEKDEEVYADWFNRHPDVKLVIAPHEFNGMRIERLRELFDNGTVLYSEMKTNPGMKTDAQVMIMDCFGLLSSAYAYCDVAYVGGGFGVGIHNINEPAVYDIPVIYGPNNARFIEAEEMARAGGGFPILNKDEFEKLADRFLCNKHEAELNGLKAGQYIRGKLGATERIYSKLFSK